jgi:subtilisin family serine protease
VKKLGGDKKMNNKLKGLSIVAWISILAIVLASAGISGVTATSEAGLLEPSHSDSEFVPNEVIVGFKESVRTQDQNGTIQKYGGRILKRNKVLNSVLVSVEAEQAFINEITKEQSVRYAERNGIVHAISPPDPKTIKLPKDLELIQYTPNDPRWSDQWGPQSIYCPQAWDVEQGDLSVLIAIVDTGIDYDHEDITHYNYCGYDWMNDDGDPWDDEGHGTHCAGIAAATMDNSVGIAGVAQVYLCAEKVLDEYGSGSSYNAALGITHAVYCCGADIISMSFGGYGGSTELENACQYAWDEGVVLAGASGNYGGTPVLYPARYDTVICVGSIDEYDARSFFSQYGPSMELVAPGENILSTTPGDNYESWDGTSMSTPHVAGVAALVMSYNPIYSNLEVRTVLADTAEDLGATGWDEYYGYGKVDAYAALGGGAPGLITQIYPSGDIYYDNNPTYTWCDPSGHVLDQWYRAEYVTSGELCSVTPSTTLDDGNHLWWILTWNPMGYGSWSDPLDFTVESEETGFYEDFNEKAKRKNARLPKEYCSIK